MKTFKTAALLAASILLSISTFITGCRDNRVAPDGKRIVKVAYLPIIHALPVFETKELFDASDDGVVVELVRYGSWPELMDALNTGRVDAASTLVELAMLARQHGIEVSAVALGHKDGNVLIVSDKIAEPADMRGKTFAIPHRQSSHHILLNDALKRAGLTPEDVNTIELTPPETPAALASGQIDGYCVAEPFGVKAVMLGVGRPLFTSEELWHDSLCCALVVNDRFVQRRPDVADLFLRRYYEAGKLLTPQRAKELGVKYLKQDEKVLEQSLPWISFDDLEITPEIYDALVDRVREYGLSKNPPSYDVFVGCSGLHSETEESKDGE